MKTSPIHGSPDVRRAFRLDRYRSKTDRGPAYPIGAQPDLGVLACEALRERSEQTAGEYPEAGCYLTWVGGRGLGTVLTESRGARPQSR